MIYRLWKAIERRIVERFNLASDIILDRRLNIDTYAKMSRDRYDPKDIVARYEPLHYESIKLISKGLRVTSEDVIYDIGCGKGRILCFFAKTKVKKCVGVELIESLAESAKQNLVRLHQRLSQAEVITGDAVAQNYDDATVIILYNPFPVAVMRSFLKTLERSLAQMPRIIRFAYANPVASEAFDECSWLKKADSFKVAYGGGYMMVYIYSSGSAP